MSIIYDKEIPSSDSKNLYIYTTGKLNAIPVKKIFIENTNTVYLKLEPKESEKFRKIMLNDKNRELQLRDLKCPEIGIRFPKKDRIIKKDVEKIIIIYTLK